MKLKIDLSAKSIDKAVDEIQKYKRTLSDRLEILIGELVQNGVEVAKVLASVAQGDSIEPHVEYSVNRQGDIVKAAIYLIGEDAVFIEFGAGIAYNTGIQHPKAGELGFGIGSYPSKTPPNKAMNPGYWFYRDESKNLHRSIGTEATMPLYHAAETIRNNLIKRAVENFLRG